MPTADMVLAKRERTRAVMAVANDGSSPEFAGWPQASIEEVIDAATVEPSLLGIRLVDLLAASRHGVSSATARAWSRRQLVKVRALAHDETLPTTIGWLLDPRRPGRILAWLDVLYGAEARARTEPWPGFPYTAPDAEAPRTPRPDVVTPPGAARLVGRRYPLAQIAQRHSPLAALGISCADRTDPYWCDAFEHSHLAAWMSRDRIRRARRQGVRGPGMGRWLAINENDAMRRQYTHERSVRLSLLAVAQAWRTVSTEQAAALLGLPQLAHPGGTYVANAVAAGLLDHGTPQGYRPELAAPEARAEFVRPSHSNAFERELAPHLTVSEIAQIRGGVRWTGQGHSERHEVLACELLLRAAELCRPQVALVLPEIWATAGQLGQDARLGTKGGDGVLVRHDGLHIVVEMTATGSNRDLRAKARAWQKLLANNFLPHVRVLWVVAPRDRSTTAAMASTVRRELREMLRDWGIGADRHAVVTWPDWFPEPGVLDGAFRQMRAQTLRSASGAWEDIYALDESSWTWAGDRYVDDDWLAVIGNAALLPAVPWWMRPSAAPCDLGVRLALEGSPWDDAPALTEGLGGRPAGKAAAAAHSRERYDALRATPRAGRATR
ncbi:hypothetical protein ACFUMH_04140 [Cellulomonas sp. NPDC057328]|uniref:hypothetical protein n=1 Tax=Cellulomonas sp. NPDC057328 TaxID=3346101 RepID=UPI003635E6D2